MKRKTAKPLNPYHQHSLSWSDLHKPQRVNWKAEAVECALFLAFVGLLVAYWLVLPAWLEG